MLYDTEGGTVQAMKIRAEEKGFERRDHEGGIVCVGKS
jgi:hypothetical protein